ncbi:MAG: hypothetical protein M0C28_29490 [Candidatus Moduliflexus flocculans]|nr:hypothetical protein [Candidatus Moduliflexus flocculans]
MFRTWRQKITATDIVVWAIGIAIAVMVVYGSAKTLALGKYTTETWIDLAITGLALGGVYALIALGYTLVYGILRMIDFAHSEVFMSGTFHRGFRGGGVGQGGLVESISRTKSPDRSGGLSRRISHDRDPG